MTALELITFLQSQPPNIKVVVRGYEDGYNYIAQIVSVNISKANNKKWYYGEYFKTDSANPIEAIELFGENKIEKIESKI